MFITALDLRAYEPNEWVLLDDLVWRLHIDRRELGIVSDAVQKIIVPRGFITDLASIPKPLRPVLNVNGPSRAPAVLHDWLYCSQLCSRKDADRLFRFALACEGVGLVARHAYYAGVRLGGWAYYGQRESGLNHEDFWTEMHS